MSRLYGKKIPYCNLNGVDVIPVIKMNNVTYNMPSGTVTQGRYAFIMYKSNADNPTVAGIDAIVFPYADRDLAQTGTDHAFGVEYQFSSPIFADVDIESTAQLVVVGEYDGAVVANAASAVEVEMEPGFAEQYFY